MKKISWLIIVLIFCSASTVMAGGPFEMQDEQAQEIAGYTRSMVGGDNYEALVREQYPEAELFWGGRLLPHESSDIDLTCLVYCEVTPVGSEPFYYYWEVKVTAMNDRPDLQKKHFGVAL